MKRPLRWILALVLASVGAYTDSASPPLLLSPTLTPGDILTTDAKVICMPGYTKTVRDVPQGVKNLIYRAYGITSHKPGEYEIDHLVSLELGSSNSIRNLWLQSYVTEPPNAHVKDRLENKLHELVCSGKLSLKEAQKAIAIKANPEFQAAYPDARLEGVESMRGMDEHQEGRYYLRYQYVSGVTEFWGHVSRKPKVDFK